MSGLRTYQTASAFVAMVLVVLAQAFTIIVLACAASSNTAKLSGLAKHAKRGRSSAEARDGLVASGLRFVRQVQLSTSNSGEYRAPQDAASVSQFILMQNSMIPVNPGLGVLMFEDSEGTVLCVQIYELGVPAL